MKIPATLLSIKTSLSERKKERKRLRGPADLYYAIADSKVFALCELMCSHVERSQRRARTQLGE